MTSRSILTFFGSAFALGAVLMGADAAQAGVESLHTPRDPDRNCDAPHHERAPGLLWTPADGVLRLNGTGPEKLEFYGHLMDAAPSADVEGLRGADARRIQGHAGPINAARGCGNVGSIVIELTLPDVRQETPGMLLIGLERIPFIAVPRLMERSSWHGANVDESPAASARTGGGGSGSTSSVSIPQTPPTVTGGNQASCSGPGCPAQGNSLQFLPSAGGSSPGSRSADISTVSECMDAYGGMAVVNGSRLTVTLPRERPAASVRCFSQYFLVHAGSSAKDVHDYLGATSRVQPTYHINNPPDGPQMTGRIHPDSGAYHTMYLRPETIATLVGEYRYTVAIGPTLTPNELELILKTDPVYGVRRISAAPTRPTADAGLIAYTHQRVRSGQRFFWKVTSTTPGLAERCFSVTQGTVSPPVGAESFPLPTNADPQISCRQPYAVTVKPAAFETDAAFDDNLFGRTLTFTLGVSTGIVAQPNSNIPNVTPRVPITLPPRT